MSSASPDAILAASRSMAEKKCSKLLRCIYQTMVMNGYRKSCRPSWVFWNLCDQRVTTLISANYFGSFKCLSGFPGSFLAWRSLPCS